MSEAYFILKYGISSNQVEDVDMGWKQKKVAINRLPSLLDKWGIDEEVLPLMYIHQNRDFPLMWTEIEWESFYEFLVRCGRWVNFTLTTKDGNFVKLRVHDIVGKYYPKTRFPENRFWDSVVYQLFGDVHPNIINTLNKEEREFIVKELDESGYSEYINYTLTKKGSLLISKLKGNPGEFFTPESAKIIRQKIEEEAQRRAFDEEKTKKLHERYQAKKCIQRDWTKLPKFVKDELIKGVKEGYIPSYYIDWLQ